MPEERRLVTVLFADVAGSTALGEQLDAEDVRAMLARYYAIAKEVVGSYGGTVEKFIGDAVMGVFGIPTAHGDDADRALFAALDLRDRVEREPALGDLRLRLGVCSGEVVATSEPGTDFLVTGDAVNVAARLQEAAQPRQVLAAERTVEGASASYQLGPLIRVEVRGKTAPIAAREVKARLESWRRRSTPRVPMRGRDAELEELALIARRAFRDSRPAFVSILAPAGTGKTRLLEEFLAHELPAIAPDALVAMAQCLPYGNQLTYWPLREVLFRLAGVSEADGPDAIRRRAAEWLGDDRRAAMLATSIGYGVDAAPDRADVFDAWRTALEKASAAQPLVAVFEDLHWSSESLLDLIDFVIQARGNAPILMVALSRPELLDRRPAWGGGRRNFSNLFLEPLRDEEMGAVVRDLLREAANGSVDAIVARAGGNPFYAEELVRSLQEHGRIATLPDTVQASIQARLDLLPTDQRKFLQLGSIFGRTFRLSGVVALGRELAPSIGALKERLLQHELLRREDEDHLSFSHVLIRDVAYQGMTRAERARLHAAAGDWLESRSEGRGSAVAELVAFHYREAVTLIGRLPDAGFDATDIRRRAVTWLARAGAAAAAPGANLEASRHYRAAIELAEGDQLPELYERLGDVEQLRGQSLDAYTRSLELGRQAGRPAVDELRVLGGLLICGLRWAEGVGRLTMPMADVMLDQGRALLDQVNDPKSRARFLAARSFYPYHLERMGGGQATADMLAVAERDAREAISLADAAEDWNTWSAALDGLSSVAVGAHDWDTVLETARIRIQREPQLNITERMDAYHMLAQAATFIGRLRDAVEAMRNGWHVLDSAQNPSLILGLYADLMHPLLHLGEWDRIVELGDQSMRVWNESHEVQGPGVTSFWSALFVARARRDQTRVAQLRGAMLQMADFVPGPRRLIALAENDLDLLAEELLPSIKIGYGRIHLIERTM